MRNTDSYSVMLNARLSERRYWLRLLSVAFLVVGLFLVGYTTARVYSAYAQNREQLEALDRVIASRRPTLPPDRDPAAARDRGLTLPLESGLVGRIDIERLGVSAAIVHGIDDDTLERAVGHIPGTALPGAEGNVGLAGHRDSFFAGLRDVRKGDRIEVRTPLGSYSYAVSSTLIVEPNDTWVLDPLPGRDLTLVTCYPFSYFGRAPERFVVHAELLGDPAAMARLRGGGAPAR